MSMHDPIADLLTQIRNAQMAKRATIWVPASGKKNAILAVLKEEGYLNFELSEKEGKPTFKIELKYFEGQSAIKTIKRISKPGLRQYKSKAALPLVMGGLGVAIVSTPKGVMTDKKARKLGQGGEVLCVVA